MNMNNRHLKVKCCHNQFEEVANWYADHSLQFPRPQVVSIGISNSTISSLTVGRSAGSTDPTSDPIHIKTILYTVTHTLIII